MDNLTNDESYAKRAAYKFRLGDVLLGAAHIL